MENNNSVDPVSTSRQLELELSENTESWKAEFLEKVHVPDELSACWTWTRSLNSGGYGHYRVPGRGQGEPPLRAHRLAYILFNGQIPDGLQLHHICENRACCNPDHLKPVTPKEHIVDLTTRSVAYRSKRVTHCPKGHPYNEENTRHKNGKRVCIECDREHSRRYYDQFRVGPKPPKTHCPKGHRYDASYQKNGKTYPRCSTCANESSRRWQEKNKEYYKAYKRENRRARDARKREERNRMQDPNTKVSVQET